MRPRLSLAVMFATVVVAAATVAGPASAAVPAPVGHLPYPAGGTNAVGAGTTVANQNAQLAETLPAKITASWKASPPLCPGTAGSDGVSVSVAGNITVVRDRQFGCSYLSAYTTSTGALLWRNKYNLAGPPNLSGSTIYFQRSKETGGYAIEALSLSTGKLIWSFPEGSLSSLAVGDGVVSSEQLVLDAATGKLKYVLPDNAANSFTLISGGVLYVNSESSVFAYTVATGKLLWSFAKPGGYQGPGSGRARLALNNGLLYVTTTTGAATALTLVLNPATGGLVRTLPRSDVNLAFDGNVGIFTATQDSSVPNRGSSVVSAINLITGAVYWTRSLPTDQYGPAIVGAASPLISNGIVWTYSGYDTGTPGHIFGLDEATGALLSTTIQPCAVAFESNGIIIAQHRMFAPSNCGILTYVASTAPTTPPAPAPAPPTAPSTPPAASLISDPGFEAGTSGWKSFTSGTLTSVTNPVRSGNRALTVTATSATRGLVGITHNTAVTSSVKGASYTMTCWVRPSTPGISLTVRFLEYPSNWSRATHLATKTITTLPAGTWTAVSFTAAAVNSNDRMIPQLYSTNQTTKTGSITYDDCSLTRK